MVRAARATFPAALAELKRAATARRLLTKPSIEYQEALEYEVRLAMEIRRLAAIDHIDVRSGKS